MTLKKNRKAQIGFLFAWFVMAMLIVVISSVLAPMGVLANVEFIQAGELILQQANESLQGIDDPTIRAAVNDSINEAFDSAQTNIDVNTDLFQYGWVILLILTAIMVYLVTRQTVEFRNFGGVF